MRGMGIGVVVVALVAGCKTASSVETAPEPSAVPPTANASAMAEAGRAFVPFAVTPAAGSLTCGQAHTCAISERRLYCWGGRGGGKLGDGYVDPSPADVVHNLYRQGQEIRYQPMLVDIRDVASASASVQTTCAVDHGGGVFCWGVDLSGQVGTSNPRIALRVPRVEGAIAVAAGGIFTCALGGDGKVVCWGKDTAGSLGGSSLAADPPRTVPVPAAVAIGAGDSFACILTKRGEVHCWGASDLQQTGGGASGDAGAAKGIVRVPGITDARSLSVGAAHACVVAGDGSVKCWGANLGNALGVGFDVKSSPPVVLAGLSPATRVAASSLRTCALGNDKKVRCWDGVMRRADTVRGLDDAVEICTGASHGCAVTSAGRVFCWGDGAFEHAKDWDRWQAVEISRD